VERAGVRGASAVRGRKLVSMVAAFAMCPGVPGKNDMVLITGDTIRIRVSQKLAFS